MRKLRTSRSPGQDGLTAEIFKAIPDEDIFRFSDIILERMARTTWGYDVNIADTWNIIKVHALQKPGKVLLTNVRLIANFGMMQKATHAAIAQRLKDIIRAKMPLSIGGVQQGDGPIMHHAIATTLARKTWEYRISMAMPTVDLTRAFATVPHSLVIKGLQRLEVPDDLIHIIGWIIRSAEIEVNMSTRATFRIRLQRGLVEGSPLSMILLAVASFMLYTHTPNERPHLPRLALSAPHGHRKLGTDHPPTAMGG